MIYIHMEDVALERINEPYCGINPAIGGVQFLAWELYVKLEIECRDQVRLMTSNNYENLRMLHGVKYVLDNETNFQSSDVLIVSSLKLHKFLHSNTCENIIVWSHHPYDFIPVHPSVKVVVTSGEWQSSSVNAKNKTYIQNFVPEVEYSNQKYNFDPKGAKFVYIGSVSPAKGLLQIAKYLYKNESLISGSEFHIIGNNGLYAGNVTSEGKLEGTYEAKVRAELSRLTNVNVVHHGLLKEKKFAILKNCDVALLNPTGKSEAFPSSVIECMSCSLPVIASNRFGMYDAMKYFPETTLNNSNSFSKIINRFRTNRGLYRDLSLRSRMLYEKYLSQNKFILKKWINLISNVQQGDVKYYDASPEHIPFYNMLGARAFAKIRNQKKSWMK